MTIFNEIYGVYFRIAGKLLGMDRVTKADVHRVVLSDGFRESVLFLPQRLTPQRDGSDWGLFTESPDGTLIPVIRNKPRSIMTLLQKRWLATKINDPKMRLFMDEDAISELRTALNVKPLYGAHHFRCTDRFTDGDPFTDPAYIRNFRVILGAIRSGTMLEISCVTPRGNALTHCCLPMQLEYSPKNDKLRLHCRTMYKGSLSGDTVINLGRITEVRELGHASEEPGDLEQYFARRRAGEPVVVRVTGERNGVERFLTEFASYEKHTVRDLETGVVTAELYYDRADETELLIQLLSFGPVLEILGPPHFRALAAERVKNQIQLIINN